MTTSNTSWHFSSDPLSRRAMLRFSLLGAAVSLAAACAPGSPQATRTGSTSAAPTSASAAQAPAATSAPAPRQTTPPAGTPAGAVVSKSGRVTLPTFMPPNWPTPDVPGGAITPAGFINYPQKLIRSVPNPPGKGGEITITTQTLAALPTPMDSNPVWQELNKRVGATMNINITPFADYGQKLPTIIAANDITDLLFLPNGQQVPGFPQFLEARCADLTPFLSGDAARDYPNLASHPTSVWKTTIFNNKVFGVGDPIPPYFWVHWHHAELLQQA